MVNTVPGGGLLESLFPAAVHTDTAYKPLHIKIMCTFLCSFIQSQALQAVV